MPLFAIGSPSSIRIYIGLKNRDNNHNLVYLQCEIKSLGSIAASRNVNVKDKKRFLYFMNITNNHPMKYIMEIATITPSLVIVMTAPVMYKFV